MALGWTGGDEEGRLRVAGILEADLRDAGELQIALEPPVEVVGIERPAASVPEHVVLFGIVPRGERE